MSSTQEAFEIAKQAEVNSGAKRGRKRPRTAAVNAGLSVDEDEVLEAIRGDSESDCIIVAGSRVTIGWFNDSVALRGVEGLHGSNLSV